MIASALITLLVTGFAPVFVFLILWGLFRSLVKS